MPLDNLSIVRWTELCYLEWVLEVQFYSSIIDPHIERSGRWNQGYIEFLIRIDVIQVIWGNILPNFDRSEHKLNQNINILHLSTLVLEHLLTLCERPLFIWLKFAISKQIKPLFGYNLFLNYGSQFRNFAVLVVKQLIQTEKWYKQFFVKLNSPKNESTEPAFRYKVKTNQIRRVHYQR